MALTAAQQVERDIAEFLANHEWPEAEATSVIAARGLVAGHWVMPHVQAFADDVREATRVKSIGTYPGHSPSIDRALDLFHAVSDNALADAISDFAIKNQDHYGVRYVIDRQQIWHRLDPVWRWMADRGDNTQNHYDHNHVSFETTAAGPKPKPKPDPKPQPVPLEEDDMALPIFGDSPDGREYAFWMIDGAFKKKLHTNAVWEEAQELARAHKLSPPKHIGKIPLAMFDALIDVDELARTPKQ